MNLLALASTFHSMAPARGEADAHTFTGLQPRRAIQESYWQSIVARIITLRSGPKCDKSLPGRLIWTPFLTPRSMGKQLQQDGNVPISALAPQLTTVLSSDQSTTTACMPCLSCCLSVVLIPSACCRLSKSVAPPPPPTACCTSPPTALDGRSSDDLGHPLAPVGVWPVRMRQRLTLVLGLVS